MGKPIIVRGVNGEYIEMNLDGSVQPQSQTVPQQEQIKKVERQVRRPVRRKPASPAYKQYTAAVADPQRPWQDTAGRALLSEEQFEQNQNQQGSINPGEYQTWFGRNIARPANNYVRELKYDLSHGVVPGGKYTLPAAALGAFTGASVAAAPLTMAAATAGGTVGGKVWDFGTKLATGKTWAEWLSEKTGLDMELTAPTNLGMLAGGAAPFGAIESGPARVIESVAPINRAVRNTVDKIERRGAETFMRTTPLANPLPEAKNGFISMWNGQQGGRQRLTHIANYILTGRRVGPKGYYNSFADFSPTNLANIVKEPTFAERWEAFKNPTGVSRAYSGFVDVNGRVPVMTERNDIIDAFLYGKDIDSSFGLKRMAVGENFGPHTDYVKTNYTSKSRDIPVYEMNTPEGIDVAIPEGEWRGTDYGLFDGGNGDFLNAAGHLSIKGKTPDGGSVVQAQDIWKFNPDDYFERWLKNKRPYESQSPLLKKATLWGLEEVDRLGTPVITKTKWGRWVH